MKFISGRYGYFLLLLLVLFVAECIVNPIGNFPLNDDWSYGKAVMYSLKGDYTIGNFGAMTLFTHLAWGMLFVKIFGFSFTVLRISTLVSVIISLFLLDNLVFRISGNKKLGFLLCLVLLFNPLFFNLSNTYMTDVNFNTLLLLCMYFAVRFYESPRYLFLFFFFISALLLVLLRQFGIIVPVCFMAGCLVLKDKRIKWLLLSLIGLILVYFCLQLYEQHLKLILPSYASYKFSGGVHFFEKSFWDFFAYSFNLRYKIVLLNVLIYMAPVAVAYLYSLCREINWRVLIGIIVINSLAVLWFFKSVPFPFSNILENTSLGPETFYESLGNSERHTHSAVFERIFAGVKFVCATLTLLSLSLLIFNFIKKRNMSGRVSPSFLFFLTFIASYVFMVCITESFFDRYFIPLITTFLLLFACIPVYFKVKYVPAMLILLFWMYVSVFGTKDYLTWNRARWEAFYDLKSAEKVNAEKVNGGFEVNCWNEGQPNWWYDYTGLNTFDYLIQFKKEEGFSLYKEYPFQRYLPFKQDRINVFVKDRIGREE
jgi:hypothetical protein